MQIAFLLYDHVTALDFVGPHDVLAGLPGAELLVVAKRAGPVTADGGAFSFVAPYGVDDVERADVLVVPGSASGTPAAMADAALLAWIRRVHETTRFTTSVCSGALILAEAGLLRGKAATTHWAAMPHLARYGAVAAPDARVVEDGKIVTAAGVSAGIDMALHLVARIAGRERAECVQLLLEYDPRPPVDSGHVSKASDAVRRLAQREMTRMMTTPRTTLALLRLAGRRFVSRARGNLGFSM